jgi:hypothetical protein
MSNCSKNIVVFDVGNTLIEKPSSIMASEVMYDLLRIQENGNSIGVATMRNLTMLEEVIAQVKFDFVIALNGAYAACGKTILIDNPIDINDLSKILKFITEKKVKYQLYTKYNILNQNISNESVYGIEVKEAYDIVYDLEELFPFFVFHIWEEGKTCDIHSKNVSKSKAMIAVCDYLGISLKRSIAFGDGFNDIELFKVCDISIAMQTAPNELKKIASFVTKSVIENGVSWALNQLKL